MILTSLISWTIRSRKMARLNLQTGKTTMNLINQGGTLPIFIPEKSSPVLDAQINLFD